METDAGKQTTESVKCKKHEKKQRKSLTKISGTDIGLNIFAPKIKGWAEVPLRKNLLKGIEDRNIKWTYTDPTIKEKEVMENFVSGLVDLTDCFHLLDDDLPDG